MLASSGRAAARRPFALSRGQKQLQLRCASGAPKTGQHTVEAALTEEALKLFFKDPVTTKPTTGGVNNVVQYVEDLAGQRLGVLRIYNNGNKSEKVHFEHAILAQLSTQKLSYEVPRPILSITTQQPYMQLSNGAEACVFTIIPGSLAKTTSPEEVGRATGELSAAMGNVSLDIPAPIPPYFEVFKVHHALNREMFYKEVETNPGFKVCQEAIDYLVSEIRLMEEKLAAFQKLDLPMQLIHGDLHYDNVMVDGDVVSGLLDFEFCAYDWRAMELAVALSKYVGEADPLPLCSSFVKGYMEKGQLNEQEIAIIPDLINLRIFSNVVYFTGRAVAGEDSLESLTSRAASYAKRVTWVLANRNALSGVIRKMAERSRALQQEVPALVA